MVRKLFETTKAASQKLKEKAEENKPIRKQERKIEIHVKHQASVRKDGEKVTAQSRTAREDEGAWSQSGNSKDKKMERQQPIRNSKGR